MQTQQLVTLVPWTLIAQLLNLALQVYLIKRFLFKPINNILQKRKEMADAEIKDAEQAKTEALAMKESYEKDMAEAKEKAGEILTSAEKTAGARSEEILREANRQAVAIKEKANPALLICLPLSSLSSSFISPRIVMIKAQSNGKK